MRCWLSVIMRKDNVIIILEFIFLRQDCPHYSGVAHPQAFNKVLLQNGDKSWAFRRVVNINTALKHSKCPLILNLFYIACIAAANASPMLGIQPPLLPLTSVRVAGTQHFTCFEIFIFPISVNLNEAKFWIFIENTGDINLISLKAPSWFLIWFREASLTNASWHQPRELV